MLLRELLLSQGSSLDLKPRLRVPSRAPPALQAPALFSRTTSPAQSPTVAASAHLLHGPHSLSSKFRILGLETKALPVCTPSPASSQGPEARCCSSSGPAPALLRLPFHAAGTPSLGGLEDSVYTRPFLSQLSCLSQGVDVGGTAPHSLEDLSGGLCLPPRTPTAGFTHAAHSVPPCPAAFVAREFPFRLQQWEGAPSPEVVPKHLAWVQTGQTRSHRCPQSVASGGHRSGDDCSPFPKEGTCLARAATRESTGAGQAPGVGWARALLWLPWKEG